MAFKIIGHSECIVELIEENDAAFVRKSTKTPDYVGRLVAQADKQQKFVALSLPEGFAVPKIYKVYHDKSSSYFDMAYVGAADFVNFFTYADVSTINELCKTILRWVDYCLQGAVFTAFPIEMVAQKFNEVKGRIALNPLVDAQLINPLLERFEIQMAQCSPNALFPTGRCHGDLTFSNMFIHDAGHITLIDLLDNFIDTPLQDIVKLRQDTQFFWSLQFYQGDFNHLHIESILRYIDAILDERFRQYPFYLEYYSLFQMLNYFRIIPYIKEERIVTHVVEAIQTLLRDSLCT